MASSSTGSGRRRRRMVMLRCSDGMEFYVDTTFLTPSRMIKSVIEDCGPQDLILVTLPEVNGVTLEEILRFLMKHIEFVDRTTEADAEELKMWDDKFLEDVDMNTLYNLLLASIIMKMKELTDLCVEKAADMMRGKQPAEIRELFNIRNKFSPEEEEGIRNENEWAFN
ncbi:hypothetical protein Cni_G24672 [Canna indica]|uniref:SKP1-like protein n=1 Tax=Canna indica TaxID=4628 RepID=A0AAQ3QKB8_9LILI|nr:hypothetical protein Cni_G24672 [Canna indica]